MGEVISRVISCQNKCTIEDTIEFKEVLLSVIYRGHDCCGVICGGSAVLAPTKLVGVEWAIVG